MKNSVFVTNSHKILGLHRFRMTLPVALHMELKWAEFRISPAARVQQACLGRQDIQK